MLKRGFLSSYAMAALMLLGTSISYLFITGMRRGTSTFAPLSPGVSASRIVLLCLSLIVIPLVPAVLISRRDSSHFGVSGMIRWVIEGALIGAVGGILSEILFRRAEFPADPQTSHVRLPYHHWVGRHPLELLARIQTPNSCI